MKKKLAIIGASYLQRPLVAKANEMGLETHVFAWREGEAVSDIATKFYPISIIEKEQILEHCKTIGINGIITVGSDLALDTVNYIALELELVGNSLYSTQLTRDKHLMREKLYEAGLPVPGFINLKGKSQLSNINFSFPYMIKAVDRSGSRGIQLIENPNEIETAYENALDVSLNGKVLAEEYFDGKQYSLEVISQNGKHRFIGITEEFYTGPPQFVETGHIMPGNISGINLKKAIELTYQALDVLGIRNGASHTEMRINNNDFCFIEIAGRMGGDFRSELIRLAYDYDFLKDAINIALGNHIKLNEVKSKRYSFIKWIMNEKDLNNYDLIKNKMQIEKFELVQHKDNLQSTIKSSGDRFGYYIGYDKTYPKLFLNFNTE